MRIEFNVTAGSESALSNFVQEAIEESRPAINEAMGKRFYEVLQGNFGIAGVDRPMAWAPLSPAYAKKVGREIATLDLTGKLRGAITTTVTPESAVVSVSNDDVPYATVHQTGGTRMPKRPYFPIDDRGEVLDYTAGEVTEAAARAMERELR